MAGLAPASEDVRSFTDLWSSLKDCAYLFTATELSSCIESGSARGGSGIPIYPKKNRQNTPKYPKFLQIYPKIIEALNTLYPKLEVSETNTYLVVLPFLAFLQMDCHHFPMITDHKKWPHVSQKNTKMLKTKKIP